MSQQVAVRSRRILISFNRHHSIQWRPCVTFVSTVSGKTAPCIIRVQPGWGLCNQKCNAETFEATHITWFLVSLVSTYILLFFACSCACVDHMTCSDSPASTAAEEPTVVQERVESDSEKSTQRNKVSRSRKKQTFARVLVFFGLQLSLFLSVLEE